MKTNHIISVLLLLLLGFTSCSKERLNGPDKGERLATYPVSFSLQSALRAKEVNQAELAALDYEKKIKSLSILVFKNDAPKTFVKRISHDDMYMQWVNKNDFYEGATFDMGEAGTFILEFITNLDDADFYGQLKKGETTHDEYLKMVVKKSVPVNKEAGFVMTNPESISITTQKNTTPQQPIEVTLRRLAARFDVFNTVEGFELTSIELVNQVQQSHVFTGTTIPTNSSSDKAFTADPGTWFDKHRAVAGIYSYEHPVPGAIKLTLKGVYHFPHHANVWYWQKTVELLDQDENPLPIRRNHLYRVILSKQKVGEIGPKPDPKKLDIDFKIEVLDWEEAEVFDYSDYEFEKTLISNSTNKLSLNQSSAEFEGSSSSTYDLSKQIVAEREIKNPNGTIDKEPIDMEGLNIKSNVDWVKVDESTAKLSIHVNQTVVGRKGKVTIALKDDPSKVVEFAINQKPNLDNPLAYMAESDVNKYGNGFVKNPYSEPFGLFPMDEVISKFSNIEIGGSSFHHPSFKEWNSVIPPSSMFSGKTGENNDSEVCSIGGSEIKGLCNYKKFGYRSVLYAIRWKNSKFLTAWRYEWLNRHDTRTEPLPRDFVILRIVSRNVSSDVTIDQVSADAFWDNNREEDVVRVFTVSKGMMTEMFDGEFNFSSSSTSSFAELRGVSSGSSRYFYLYDIDLDNVDLNSKRKLNFGLFLSSGYFPYSFHSPVDDGNKFVVRLFYSKKIE